MLSHFIACVVLLSCELPLRILCLFFGRVLHILVTELRGCLYILNASPLPVAIYV